MDDDVADAFNVLLVVVLEYMLFGLLADFDNDLCLLDWGGGRGRGCDGLDC